MDSELIAQKVESLHRCIQRTREKCPVTAAALSADADAQDIVALNLTRAIQLCVDIGAHLIAGRDITSPTTMGQTFDTLATLGIISNELAARMKKTVGFRNIAVHNYEAIDWQIVHAIATRHLDDFKDFARAVVE